MIRRQERKSRRRRKRTCSFIHIHFLIPGIVQCCYWPVFNTLSAHQSQILSFVQCQSLMNMSSWVDECSLRSLLAHGEYLLLITQLFTTFLAHQHSALRQEWEGDTKSLHWTVEGEQGVLHLVLQGQVGGDPPGELGGVGGDWGDAGGERGELAQLGSDSCDQERWGVLWPDPAGQRTQHMTRTPPPVPASCSVQWWWWWWWWWWHCWRWWWTWGCAESWHKWETIFLLIIIRSVGSVGISFTSSVKSDEPVPGWYSQHLIRFTQLYISQHLHLTNKIPINLSPGGDQSEPLSATRLDLETNIVVDSVIIISVVDVLEYLRCCSY